jgi:hypothetical protein
MLYLIIYIVGIPISVIFLTKFGKHMGLYDYDKPKTYADFDDYSSNGSAYLAFSTMWPIFYLMHGVAFLNKRLVTSINKKIKNTNEETNSNLGTGSC